ncbi:MAG: DUF3352 domain-containing protein, partial [Candidatus Sumerlaeota bacterium]|nr:DUF3352 domain-containing protein [Candidatus Sumerlaeota bacterium]
KTSVGDAQFVAVIQGRFDAVRLMKGVETIEGVKEKISSQKDYKGVRVYSDKEPGKEGCWAISGQSILISNDPLRLEKAIDAVQANVSAFADAKLAPYLSAARTTSTLWAVGYAPNKPKAADPPPPSPRTPGGRAPANAQDPVDLVRHFSLALDNKYGADFETRLTCKDAASAAQLKNQLELMRGILSIALMQANPNAAQRNAAKTEAMQQSAARLNQTLQKLTVEAFADTVTLSLKQTLSENNEFMLALNAYSKAAKSENPGSGASKRPALAPVRP